MPFWGFMNALGIFAGPDTCWGTIAGRYIIAGPDTYWELLLLALTFAGDYY